ncbi:MAG: hypothetical protein RIQ93_642 [Verrucomicrobiota bacterium]|jgi:predicted dehydrogenase
MSYSRLFTLLASLFLVALAPAADVRLGFVGLDTSHSAAFTKILHDPAAKDHVAGARVVGAYKEASALVEVSARRAEEGRVALEKDFGIKMYPSIEALAKDVDVILIESADGNAHLDQARRAILTGKPVFVDKPMAASVKDAVKIFALAKEHNVPIFSSSSLRFAKATQAVRHGSIGKVREANTGSPVSTEPHHPELFWYGIHGVESLVTVMGTGLESVTRKSSENGAIVVEGQWAGGRKGAFRQGKYVGKAIGDRGEADVGSSDGYAPLVAQIVQFARTGVSPIPEQETIEILAFMEADARSKELGGKPVKIADILKEAGWNQAKK